MHSLSLTNNASLHLEGITAITRYGDREVLLRTDKYKLTIGGDHLKVDKVDISTGVADISGDITLVKYTPSEPVGNILKKLVK